MDHSPMLAQMCHEGFTQADLNAIAKARGFRKQETASRSTFESFFLSTIGVENALAALIIPPNTVTVRQWISELRDKTTLEPDQIGEYSGLTKEIHPVTIDTYETITYRKWGSIAVGEYPPSRILRPKKDGSMAHFYTLVTRDTVDQSFAANRQRFLTEQGYKYEILYEDEVLNGR